MTDFGKFADYYIKLSQPDEKMISSAQWYKDWFNSFKNDRYIRKQKKNQQQIQNIRSQEDANLDAWLKAFESTMLKYKKQYDSIKRNIDDIVSKTEDIGINLQSLIGNDFLKYDDLKTKFENLVNPIITTDSTKNLNQKSTQNQNLSQDQNQGSSQTMNTPMAGTNVIKINKSAQINPAPYINKFRNLMQKMENILYQAQAFIDVSKKNISMFDPNRIIDPKVKQSYNNIVQKLGINSDTSNNNQNSNVQATPSSATTQQTNQNAPQQQEAYDTYREKERDENSGTSMRPNIFGPNITNKQETAPAQESGHITQTLKNDDLTPMAHVKSLLDEGITPRQIVSILMNIAPEEMREILSYFSVAPGARAKTINNNTKTATALNLKKIPKSWND